MEIQENMCFQAENNGVHLRDFLWLQLQHCFEVKICIEAEESASFFALSVMLSHATYPKVRGVVENAKFVIGYSHLLFDVRFATKKQQEIAKTWRMSNGWLVNEVL